MDIFGIHDDALMLRARRAEVLAGNIANADTPDFKARDIDFKSILKNIDQASQALHNTEEQHLASGLQSLDGVELQYRSPLQSSLDNNTVDLQAERSAFLENSMQYQASLRFVNGRISGLLTAIRGEI